MSLQMSPQRISMLIIGTDTGVGKTLVTGGLAGAFRKRGYRVGNMKPAETGCREEDGELVPEDALFVRRLSGCESPLQMICPYRFQESLAPSVAASREGKSIDPEKILSAFEEIRSRHDVTLIEGIGGFHVPITQDFWVSEMAERLGLPILVVARLGLGTLNHTLLTLEAVAKRSLRVLGVVLNTVTPPLSIAEKTNPTALSSLTDVPLLGVLPHLPAGREGMPDPESLVDSVEKHLEAQAVEAALGLSTEKRFWCP